MFPFLIVSQLTILRLSAIVKLNSVAGGTIFARRPVSDKVTPVFRLLVAEGAPLPA